MDEERAVRREMRGDTLEQPPVVPNVLDHLDRDDAVEAAPEIEIVDVGEDDLEAAVGTDAARSLAFDVLAL